MMRSCAACTCSRISMRLRFALPTLISRFHLSASEMITTQNMVIRMPIAITLITLSQIAIQAVNSSACLCSW